MAGVNLSMQMTRDMVWGSKVDMTLKWWSYTNKIWWKNLADMAKRKAILEKKWSKFGLFSFEMWQFKVLITGLFRIWVWLFLSLPVYGATMASPKMLLLVHCSVWILNSMMSVSLNFRSGNQMHLLRKAAVEFSRICGVKPANVLFEDRSKEKHAHSFDLPCCSQWPQRHLSISHN
mgnify:CR=1 FL=1